MATLTLYAQPSDLSPHVRRRDLEEGRYEESASLFGVLPMTDIGARCWDVAVAQFPQAELSLIESHGFGGLPWTVLIQCRGLSVTLSLASYTRLKGAQGLLLTIEVEGTEMVLRNYLRRIVVKAEHPPWKVYDEEAFEGATSMSAVALRKRWRQWSTKEERLARATVKAKLPDKVLLTPSVGLEGGGVRFKVVVANQTANALKDVVLRFEGNGILARSLEQVPGVPRINTAGEATLLSDFTIDPLADEVRLRPTLSYVREGSTKRRTLDEQVVPVPLPTLEPWRIKQSAWDGTTQGFVRQRLRSVRRLTAASEVLDELLQQLQGLPLEALPPEVSKRSGAFRGTVRWSGTDPEQGRYGLELSVSGGPKDCRIELLALTSKTEDLPRFVRWIQRHQQLGALLVDETPAPAPTDSASDQPASSVEP